MRDKIVISDRMEAVASMVTRGNRVCDVGCDHAFVPIYLINQGISPYVIAMDVRKGPLGQAKEHIREYGLDTYIETRLSDGLEQFESGEADSLICAGMGGKLMMNILEKDAEKTASFKELILQPQSELQQFRCFLRSQGYMITDENMIEEGGKFYSVIKVAKAAEREVASEVFDGVSEEKFGDVEPCKTLPSEESFNGDWHKDMADRYGPVLIANKHPVLCKYINWEIGIYEEVLSGLELQDVSKPKIKKRYEEVSERLKDCKKVLKEIAG
ncbi:MAG: SAM-dependent methyltransferase [Lachnospiraceae bacterium]|nr:SAM-dependent methyltransferase [Lachnospiraceae bacterium]